MSAYNVFMEEKYKLKEIASEMEEKAYAFGDTGNIVMKEILFDWANAIRASLADIEDAIHEENYEIFKNTQKQIGETLAAAFHKGENNE